MIPLTSVFLGFLVIFLSFTEFLVFNEEILLVLCFVSFLFFLYSFAANTVSAFFKGRSESIEASFLSGFRIHSETLFGRFEFFHYTLIHGYCFLFFTTFILLRTNVEGEKVRGKLFISNIHYLYAFGCFDSFLVKTALVSSILGQTLRSLNIFFFSHFCDNS